MVLSVSSAGKAALVVLIFQCSVGASYGFANPAGAFLRRTGLPHKSTQNSIRHKAATPLFMSSNVMEQYLQSQQAMERERREERTKGAYEEQIRRMMDDGIAENEKFLSPAFWMQFSRGLTIADDCRQATIAARYQRSIVTSGTAHPQDAQRLLHDRGFCAVEALDWNGVGVDLAAISATMENLKANGWPPVFVFMFDEAWRLCEALFEIMAPLIQDDRVLLEASVYGWALDKQDGSPAQEKVGGNFGTPHRDSSFSNCHLHDGSSSILSVWIPTVDVDIENGCMYVIPRERDVYFDKSEDPAHLNPLLKGFPYADVRPLPGKAGTVFVWHPNTIHWGSACSAYAPESRKSIAMAFRLSEERRAFTEKEFALYGRRPFDYAEIAGGLDMKERLKVLTPAS